MGFILIPRYGIIGFQITTILAPNLGYLYAQRWVQRNMGIKLDINNTLKILTSTILGYVACKITQNLLHLNPWFELLIGGTTLATVYLIFIMLTGALTTKNINDIKTITDRHKPTKKISETILNTLLKIAKE
jgi:hypothetical protein